MTVQVRFDRRVWGRLASMADTQGVTVAELIERSVERLVTGTTRTARSVAKESRAEELRLSREAHKAALVAEVKRLRKDGMKLRAIAEEVGYSTTYVSKLLTDNGMRTRNRTVKKEMG